MKKISINNVMATPPNIEAHCSVFNVTDEVLQWVEVNGLDVEKHSKGYLNIHIEGLRYRYDDIFYYDKPYFYFDGFSPNLNKELHIGHLSNLVYASAISNLCSYLTPVSILNDTDNHKNKTVFYDQYKEFCELFNYHTDRDYFSSEMDIDGFSKTESDFDNRYLKEIDWKKEVMNLEDDFKGCRGVVSPITKTKMVVKKSDDTTTYLGQDLDFARKLKEPILYLTGAEQNSHFEIIKEFYPKNNHIGIGLITTDKEKMSSRKGNVVFLKEVLEEYDVNTLKDAFLSYNMKTFKNNVKIEKGISEKCKGTSEYFEDEKLYITYLKSIQMFSPSLLFKNLDKASENDIDFGLKLLGYKN